MAHYNTEKGQTDAMKDLLKEKHLLGPTGVGETRGITKVVQLVQAAPCDVHDARGV